VQRLEQIIPIPLSFLPPKKAEFVGFRAVIRADKIGMADMNITIFFSKKFGRYFMVASGIRIRLKP
jgi:hypothetical protein